jgi:hypothetical protein
MEGVMELKKETLDMKTLISNQKPSIHDNANHTDEIKQMQSTLDALQTDMKKLKRDLDFYKLKRNEAFYQSILEEYLGNGHKKLPIGITDVTTDTCHAEIKEWSCYKEAIGQLMAYNVCDPKEKLEMYMFGCYKDSCKEEAYKVISACNIDLYEFVNYSDRVDIVRFQDKSVKFSFICGG